jgi:hypothetical protein
VQLKCVKTCCPWQDVLSFCSRKSWKSISFLWNIIGTGILQSSFNLFPKSTLPNCKIYNANFYGATLPSWLVCQIHLVTLWSSHCQVHVAKSTFPSCELHIAKSTPKLSTPHCQVHLPKLSTPHCQGNHAKLWSPLFPLWFVQMSFKLPTNKVFFIGCSMLDIFSGPSMEFGWLSLNGARFFFSLGATFCQMMNFFSNLARKFNFLASKFHKNKIKKITRFLWT